MNDGPTSIDGRTNWKEPEENHGNLPSPKLEVPSKSTKDETNAVRNDSGIADGWVESTPVDFPVDEFMLGVEGNTDNEKEKNISKK